MIALTELVLSRDDLKGIPAEELRLFVSFGHLANEIGILNKLLYWASDFPERADEPIIRAHSAQSLVLLKLLAGKVYEGWNLVRETYFRPKISQEYDKLLDPLAELSLNRLKQYFGKENAILKTRNLSAFHYDARGTEAAIDNLLDVDPLTIYLSADRGNSLYYFSDVISNVSILNEIDANDREKAIDTLMAETHEISENLANFVHSCMVIVADRYLTHLLEPKNQNKVVLNAVRRFRDVKIPYFFDPQRSE